MLIAGLLLQVERTGTGKVTKKLLLSFIARLGCLSLRLDLGLDTIEVLMLNLKRE